MKTSKALLILFAVMLCMTLSYGEAQAQPTFTLFINWGDEENMDNENVDISITFYDEFQLQVDGVDLVFPDDHIEDLAELSTWTTTYSPDPTSVSWEVSIDQAIPFEVNPIMDGDDVHSGVNVLNDEFVYDD